MDLLSRQLESVLSSAPNDLAFLAGADKMLANKELKAKKKQIENVEAEWSRAQKDITKAKISLTNELADTLAREQSKMSFWFNALRMVRNSSTMHLWPHKRM